MLLVGDGIMFAAGGGPAGGAGRRGGVELVTMVVAFKKRDGASVCT